MLKKLFGGIRMTWPCLVIFAVISGLVTGLVALLVPDGKQYILPLKIEKTADGTKIDY